MFEQSKAVKRRFHIGAFHNSYFVGYGIDIGCGQDSLNNYRHVFRSIEHVRGWDLPDGDAQYLKGVDDNTYDFVTSSHCLEHMVDVVTALTNWIRVCKRGGYIVITIPDEEMYEHDYWPSRYNSDHKWSFTLRNPDRSKMPKSINVLNLLTAINNQATVEKIEVIRDLYYPNAGDQDQTLHPSIECCIEIILRKV
jgi:SAM-dependent methyltransferase